MRAGRGSRHYGKEIAGRDLAAAVQVAKTVVRPCTRLVLNASNLGLLLAKTRDLEFIRRDGAFSIGSLACLAGFFLAGLARAAP